MADKIKLGMIMVRTVSGIAFITSQEFDTETEALEWANKQVKFWIKSEKLVSYRTKDFKTDDGKESFATLQDEMRLTGDNGASEFWCGVDTRTRLNWTQDKLKDKILQLVSTTH